MTNLVDKCNSYIIDNARLSEQLAASQTREKALRDVLELLCNTSNAEKREKYWLVAAKALANPSDDSALKAALAAERERFITIVNDNTDADGICAADDIIRALGDT